MSDSFKITVFNSILSRMSLEVIVFLSQKSYYMPREMESKTISQNKKKLSNVIKDMNSAFPLTNLFLVKKIQGYFPHRIWKVRGCWKNNWGDR